VKFSSGMCIGACVALKAFSLDSAHAISSLPGYYVDVVEKPETRNLVRVSAFHGAVEADTIEGVLVFNSNSLAFLAAELAKPRQLASGQDFYTEFREFKSPVVRVRVVYFNGLDTEILIFPITPANKEVHSIQFKGFMSQINFEFVGQQDLYTCFDSNTCVFSKSVETRILVDQNTVSVPEQYRTIGDSQNKSLKIEKLIANDSHLRFSISDEKMQSAIGVPAVFLAHGKSVSDKTSFVSSFSSLYQYGNGENRFSIEAVAKAGGVSVKTERKPYFNCIFKRTISYTDTATIPMPLGSNCAFTPQFLGDRWNFSHATEGENNTLIREVFFPEVKFEN
jgi:hypothetical protein